ncbi:MAG TPA: hypothetical protein VMV69_00585 [Pirellulales bacterium]|nr:hypothetical protein [Pirellulales bacterium]
MRLRAAGLLLLVGWAWGVASPVRCEEPLDALPRGTALVLRIASIDKIAGGFKELVGALGPAAAVAGPQFESGLGELFHVGAGAGVIDRAAPCFVAVFSIKGPPEPVAYLVQTADETKLRRAVLKAADDENVPAEKIAGGFEKLVKNDQTWFFGRHGPWVLYTRNEQVFQQLVFDRSQTKTLATLVEPRAAELLAAGDGAVWVNLEDLSQHYASEIKRGREQVMSFVQALPDDQLGGNGAGPEVARRLLKDVASLAFDGLGDATWFAGRLNFSAAGASMEGLLGVRQSSGTDTVLAANPPSDFETLGLLPAGSPVYFGHAVNYERIVAWAGERLKGIYGEAENARLETALAAIRAAGAGPSVMSFAFPADAKSGKLGTSLSQAENPDLLRQGGRDLQMAQGRNSTPVLTQTVEYQEGAETYQDRPVDLLTVKIEMAKVDDPGLLIVQQFLRSFFGGDALQRRITALEGLLVEASGNDPKFLHQAVNALDTGKDVLGLDEAFAKTRDQLAERANVIALLNVPRLIVDLVKLLREVPAIAPNLAQVPFNFGFQPEVSFAGLTVGTEAQGLRLRIFVPLAQPKGVLRIFGQGF